MIGIVNYGMGNLASVLNALNYLEIKARIISSPNEIQKMDKIILPGVGAFGQAMKNLNELGLSNSIKEFVIDKKKPILGICLGMQLLLEVSCEHGSFTGLGIINGEVLFFGDSISSMPIPHMGWNDVLTEKNTILYRDIDNISSYYFVHSYYCKLKHLKDVATTTTYGITFHSSLEHENVFGCQFHPEKSQKDGLRVFKNFNAI